MMEESVNSQQANIAASDKPKAETKESLSMVDRTPPTNGNPVPATQVILDQILPGSLTIGEPVNGQLLETTAVNPKELSPIIGQNLPTGDNPAPGLLDQIPVSASLQTDLFMRTLQPYDIVREMEKEWLAQTKEPRYWCRWTLAISMGLLAVGTLTILTLVSLAVVGKLSLSDIGPFLTSMGGLLSDIGGVVLFKFYQSQRADMRNIWERLDSTRIYTQRMVDASKFLSQMTSVNKKDDLIIEIVKGLLSDPNNS